MNRAQARYLRFVSLRLRDYGVFGGFNEFRFDRHRTLIVGKGGTGKTIISEVLKNLGSSRTAQGAKAMKNHGVSSVAVVTEGNCELINQYRNLIFLNEESPKEPAAYKQELSSIPMVSDSEWKEITKRTWLIFQTILSLKPGKIDLHRDLNSRIMAAGERICLGYALAFAVRGALKLDIPVVFDSPYARLDEELCKGLRLFLDRYPCQQILLGYEHEFPEEENPTYALVYVEEHSHVMEF